MVCNNCVAVDVCGRRAVQAHVDLIMSHRCQNMGVFIYLCPHKELTVVL